MLLHIEQFVCHRVLVLMNNNTLIFEGSASITKSRDVNRQYTVFMTNRSETREPDPRSRSSDAVGRQPKKSGAIFIASLHFPCF
jgi:hypothetical protein